jgi:hypothetical protein
MDRIKQKIIEQVLWAENTLRGKTGAEKKEAVLKRIDEMIKLPGYLEWVDDMVISYLIDMVCKQLNDLTHKHFEGLLMDDRQKAELAESIEDKKND